MQPCSYTIVITCTRACLKELTTDLEGQFLCLDGVSVLGSEVSFQSHMGCILVRWQGSLGITFLNQLNLDERVSDFSCFYHLPLYGSDDEEGMILPLLRGPYPRVQEQGEQES